MNCYKGKLRLIKEVLEFKLENEDNSEDLVLLKRNFNLSPWNLLFTTKTKSHKIQQKEYNKVK